MSTFKVPPKKLQAASQPAITAAVVCENVRYTKRYRDSTAVNTSARSFRPPVPVADHGQVAEVDLHLLTGLPSATGTVTCCRDEE